MVLNNAVGGLLGAVALFFTGRYMPPEAVGMVAFALSLSTLASFLVAGLDTAHIKRVSEGRDLGDCLRTYYAMRATVNLASLAVAGLLLWVWQEKVGFQDATTIPILVLMLAHLGVNFYRFMLVDTFMALQQTAKLQASALAENLGKSPAQILAALAVGIAAGNVGGQAVRDRLGLDGPLSVEQAALLYGSAFFLGSLSALAVAAWIHRRSHYPVGRFDPALAASYARFALPVTLFAPVWSLATEMDSILIGYFWDAAEVGYYFAAKRILLLVAVVPSAIAAVFFPMISERAARNDHQAIQGLVWATLRNLSLVLSPLLMLVFVYAPQGIHVFLSDAYLPAAPILRWLAIYTFLLSLAVVISTVVQGYGHPWRLVVVGLVGVTTNLVFNVLLVPASIHGVPLGGMKGVGSAIATTIAQVAAMAVLAWQMPREARGRLPVGPVAKHLFAAVAVGAAAWFAEALPFIGEVDRFYELAIIGPVALVAYVGLLRLLREVDGSDWTALRELLDPRKMRGYVAEELASRP